MSSEWPTYKIEDVAERVGMGPFGSSIKVETFVESGIPIISGEHLHDITITEGRFRFITEAHADKLSKSNVYRGDVVFTHAGTIGQVSVIPEHSKYERYVLSQRQFFMRCNRSIVDPLYIAYYFKSAEGRHKLLANASQVGVPSIARPVTYLRSLDIPIPPLNVQHEIIECIESLRNRITLLRKTNATLEAIAQALFKSWFVDFDPVRAKMEGRAPEGMDEATAALFPDSFEESELGLVPKGWSVRNFRQTIDVIGGGTPKTSNPEYWGGDIPWFSVVDAPNASDIFVIETEKHITEAGLSGSSTKLLPTGTTIISARGTVGRLALTGCPMAMNQSCYGLRGKAGDEYFTYFSTTRLVQQLKQRAHGSVFDTITQETFAGVCLSYPEADVIAAFDTSVEPLLLRIRENLVQAKTLATLRDTLLPRLISGQLRLHDIEPQLHEEAV